MCITSDFAALSETAKYGVKIHTDGRKWMKKNTLGDSDNMEKYVDAILNQPKINVEEMKQWAKKVGDWDGISKKWLEVLTNC